ncbi:hypothetical protein E4T39_05855 [Aureobasidium subglaciale]|nr:hypothetical protein E4T39_05855 [Aureobasidium subglaciale]
MDNDWQETAFSTRHMHNRQNRNNPSKSSGKSKRNTFDVRKTFGSYSCKCPSWFKVYNESRTEGQKEEDAVLELYRLTKDGRGVVGEISLPGVMRAAVVLVASRKVLKEFLECVEVAEEDRDGTKEENANGEEEDDEEEEEEEESGEEPGNDRFETFEKNSFREPKFWLRWSGVISSEETEKAESGLGYIIFPSNDCRKFKGTLNCASLEWKDVALSGHKIAPRSESDIPVAWGPQEVPI